MSKQPSKHVDPLASKNAPEEEEDEEIEDEEEFDLVEALNSMTVHQRRKVYAIKGLTVEYRKLRQLYLEELAALQLKDLVEHKQQWAERSKIVNGIRDITAEELAAIKVEDVKQSTVEEIPSDEDESAPKDAKKKGVKIVTPAEEKSKGVVAAAGDSETGGIPNFWLTAMKNNEVVEGMISERDEACLSSLTDVTFDYIDGNPRKGFTLEFLFAKNEFFTNEKLTKKYLMVNDATTADEDDDTLDSIEGCEINWTSLANKLTVVVKQKKQRHKSGKGVRIVQREEKCNSFFHFFEAPVEPKEGAENDEEDDEELPYEEALEMDYESGLAFAQNLVPRAVHYYSGKAIEEIASGLNMDGFDGEDDEEEEGEEDEEDEEDEVVMAPQKGGQKGGRGAGGGAVPPPKKAAGKQPECKQQ